MKPWSGQRVSCRHPTWPSRLYLKHSVQNIPLQSQCFHLLAPTHQIRSAVCRRTAGHVCCGIVPADPRLRSLSGTEWLANKQLLPRRNNQACGLRLSLQARDTIMSVSVGLQSPHTDVEDFDGVVGAGAGKLDPGAILLDFTPSVSLSSLLVILFIDSTGSGPPAEPLDRWRVTLSVKGCVVKGNNRTTHWMTERALRRDVFASVGLSFLKYTICTKKQAKTYLAWSRNMETRTSMSGKHIQQVQLMWVARWAEISHYKDTIKMHVFNLLPAFYSQ